MFPAPPLFQNTLEKLRFGRRNGMLGAGFCSRGLSFLSALIITPALMLRARLSYCSSSALVKNSYLGGEVILPCGINVRGRSWRFGLRSSIG